jgi:uncharacterized membrane protein
MPEAAAWYQQLPPGLAVFLVATLPISELRGAIPIGYALHAGPPLAVFLLAVAGNMVPVLPLLLLLGLAERRLRRFQTCQRFLDWWFERALRRSRSIRRYGPIGLTLFVAIPAPVTGAWTGAAVAYLLKLPLRQALPCIILGILIAGIVVSLLTAGGFYMGAKL